MWGSHRLTLETGEIARQATGAVLVQLGQSDGTWREGFRVWAVRDMRGSAQEEVPEGRVLGYLEEKANG